MSPCRNEERIGTEAGQNANEAVLTEQIEPKGLRTMKLLNIFKNFAKDESGAVTVDFVVLTAGIVGLGILIINAVTPEVTATAEQIATDMQNAREVGRD